MSLNHELSDMFKTMAAILEIRGEPVFKAIAFSKVGRLLDDATIDIRKLVETNDLESLSGVGKSSRQIIDDFVKTGKSADYDSLASSIPATLIDMLQLPGLGPKTIAMLWKERGITTIDELGHAIEGGKLDGLKGIGAKKIEQLKQSISLRDQAGKRFGILEALRIGQLMLDEVKKIKGVDDAEVAGSLRRMKETVGDLDILVTLKPKASGSEVTAAFVTLPQVTHVLGQGPSKASVMTSIGLQVDLRVVPKENFGAALLYFTGSKEHNIRLRARAQSMGLTLNEWGLYNDDEWEAARSKTKSTAESILPSVKAIASTTEESVYKALKLSYIEPELREDRGEVALAEAKKLPKLVEISDIKGELHCHTTASDGEHSIEQMAARAKEIGYSYIVITDHSKSQVVARGLEAERLEKQIEQVRKISASIPDFTILIGSEVDILSDGALDYPDALLKELDFVVASPHVALRQDMAKATERMLRAIDNKYVNVIGHPTGRLINQRSGLEYDWTKVFKAAAANGTAMEINASYPRLDLTDLAARAAIEANVMLSIDTDAHSVDSLPEIALGVAVARRAGATKAHILNCQPLDTLRKWVKSKRDR